MVWGGYRDVVDVDLYAKMPNAQQTPDPYGSNGEAVWSRIDHCLYPYYEVRDVQPCYWFQKDDIYALQACLTNCKTFYDRNAGNCPAVNVVPALTPKGTVHD
eukprot:UN15301